MRCLSMCAVAHTGLVILIFHLDIVHIGCWTHAILFEPQLWASAFLLLHSCDKRLTKCVKIVVYTKNGVLHLLPVFITSLQIVKS